MNIKKVFGEVLKKVSGSVVTASPASMSGYGVEEMPKSMKESR